MDGWSRKLVGYGFYTAHSADGFHWHMDSELPRWLPGDTSSACWDEYRQWKGGCSQSWTDRKRSSPPSAPRDPCGN